MEEKACRGRLGRWRSGPVEGVVEVEEQACMRRLGRWKNRTAWEGWGGGGAGLIGEVGEVKEQANFYIYQARESSQLQAGFLTAQFLQKPLFMKPLL